MDNVAVLAVVVCGLLTAGCSGADEPKPPAGPAVACAHDLGGTPPTDDGYRLVCPSGSGWLAFAGGYTVRAPACVPLLVEAHGRRERVEVSVGATC